MIQIAFAGFVFGLLGSLHCVGMCGPIALSLHVNHQNNFGKFLGILTYNIGRAITYTLMGLLLGSVSAYISWVGWQQKLSIIMGVLILISLIFLIHLAKRIN